jgi:hypothetical protein
MIGRTRVALKFFVYGLLIGLFFAPSSGAETRARVLSWVRQNFKGAIDSVSGGGSTQV